MHCFKSFTVAYEAEPNWELLWHTCVVRHRTKHSEGGFLGLMRLVVPNNYTPSKQGTPYNKLDTRTPKKGGPASTRCSVVFCAKAQFAARSRSYRQEGLKVTH